MITSEVFFVSTYAQKQQDGSSGVTDLFVNIDFIYGFLGALGGLVPMVIAVALFLKKSVNSSANEFIQKQTEQIKEHQEHVSTQITQINNNVNEKFLASKESIIDIKRTIEDIDEKLDKSRDQNTENRTRINDIDRRVANLEHSVRNSGRPMGTFGVE